MSARARSDGCGPCRGFYVAYVNLAAIPNPPPPRASVVAGRMFFSGRHGPEKQHDKVSTDRLGGGFAARRSYVFLGSKWPSHWRIPTDSVALQSLLWLLQLPLCPALFRAILLFSAPLLSGRLSRRSSLPLLGLVLLVVVASSSVLATPSAKVAAMTSTSRNLKPFATTYWAPYTCEITFYLQHDHPSGARHLIARCGKGYSGPFLPVVDGMPEFARPIPRDMNEQDIIYGFVAPWAAPRPFPTQEGNA